MKLIDLDDDRYCVYDGMYGTHKNYLIAPDAPIIQTKQFKYFDEDEKVWKVGSVIVDG